MISICIPIYNFNVTRLVQELTAQLPFCTVPVELILIDDCSDIRFRKVNETACAPHTYIELEKNKGRAKIRNLFLEHASFECLLFLDCDSYVISSQFISDYCTAYLETKSSVICGGRIYDHHPPKRNRKLSWKYGTKKESKSVSERLAHPYQSFMTNNFMVHRSVLTQIPFEERLTNYGHEDTLFGYFLKQQKVPIHHINNPVLNGDVEENSEYLKKTRLAIENLVVILAQVEDKKEFTSAVTLLAFHQTLQQKKVLRLVLFLAPVINAFFIFLTHAGLVSLTLFNYYKLSYLSQVLDKKKS